jgi:hypothetical protein
MEKNGFVPGGILRLLAGPWVVLCSGAAVLTIAMISQAAAGLSIIPLVFAGIVAVAIGVAVRPGDWRVLIAAAGCALLARWGLLKDWDSLRMLLFVCACVALVCAAVVSLPRVLRRVAFSLLIVFHFSAICCTVMNVNPSPWLTNYLWAHYFQNYLNFIYLTNAYHFYAPEPGPGMMLWFDVHYDDGSDQWVKLPVRSNQRWLLSYQRRLSLPENANQVLTLPALPQETVQARALAGSIHGIPFYYDNGADMAEYRPANYSTKFMLESYARHVALSTPHPTDPTRKVVGVKVYRVIHRMLTVKEVALGLQPDKKWLYQPYFQGEFDVDGNLKNPQDPYLYWLIPIKNVKNPRLSSGQAVELDTQAALHQDDDILDCLEIHSKLPTILPPNQANTGLGAAPIPGAPEPAAPIGPAQEALKQRDKFGPKTGLGAPEPDAPKGPVPGTPKD